MDRISVIIICKNAEKTLSACLTSVKWADEIIVLDAGSDDQSFAIAKRFTDHVYATDWPGFGPQKNRALSYATGDWILSIDTDEWLTDELQHTLRNFLKTANQATHSCYQIKRQSYFCGRLMRYGSWGNDWCARLFKRGSAHFTDDRVHERLVCQTSPARLPGILKHAAYDNLGQVIDKMNTYSTLGAEMRAAKQQDSHLFKALSRGIWTFFRDYIIKRGFLDGKAGFILAISNAEGCYYRYLKLMMLSKLAPE